jgi:hypothetical protein
VKNPYTAWDECCNLLWGSSKQKALTDDYALNGRLHIPAFSNRLVAKLPPHINHISLNANMFFNILIANVD